MGIQIALFVLYVMVGILMNIGGIGVFSHPILFFGVLVCVGLVDALAFKQGLDSGLSTKIFTRG